MRLCLFIGVVYLIFGCNEAEPTTFPLFDQHFAGRFISIKTDSFTYAKDIGGDFLDRYYKPYYPIFGPFWPEYKRCLSTKVFVGYLSFIPQWDQISF